MAKWKGTMLKKPKNMPYGSSRELCKGYMMVGEEVPIEGGITLDFRTKNVFYYVLKATDQFCYQMVAYRDKKHFKKKNDPPVAKVRYTGQVLVHRFFIGRKDGDKEAIFVVIHAQRPTYYKPDQKEAEKWFEEFSKVVQYSKAKANQPKNSPTPANSAPINSPERYVPIQDNRYLGEYVSMRSLPGPKKSPQRSKPQEQQTPTATVSRPPGVSAVSLSGAVPKRLGDPSNPPDIKQNPSKAPQHPKLSLKPGQKMDGAHAKQGANASPPSVKRALQVPQTRKRSDSSSSNSSGQSQTLSQSSSQRPIYDELSLPSIYAPSEITIDEMELSTSDDDEQEETGTKESPMTSRQGPLKPIGRGRSFKRVKDGDKFVWSVVHTPSDEENRISHPSNKLGQLGSSQDQVLKKKGELKKVPGSSPGSATSASHQTSTSSVTKVSLRLAGRRRSISDPADPNSLLPPMQNLGRLSGMSDEWPFGQRRVASATFIRDPDQQESVRSSTFLENNLGGHHHKHGSLEGISGHNKTVGRFRDPIRDPLPTPFEVTESTKATYQKRHSVIATDERGEIYHTSYDVIASVESTRSRKLVAELSEQAGGCVHIKLKKHDANKGLVFVKFKSKIWIATWRKDINGVAKFQEKLHIGDELISVDGNDVHSVKHTTELIGSSSGDMVTLLIHRMPLAKVVFLTKSMTDTWGCQFSKNEIIKMYPGPFKDGGIEETPYGPTGKETTWVATEFQHQPVPIITCEKDEVKNHLFNAKTELPLVLHPKDFIDGLIVGLKKNPKIAKNVSDYQL